MTPRAELPRTVVLVSGSGSNLQAILDQAAAGAIATQIAAVVSDRPGILALERARRAGVGAITVDYSKFPDREAFNTALDAELSALRPQLVVLAGFMRILTPGLVNQYRGRMLNVHPSLLPRYQGLHTYRRVLDAGDAWHGSTVHFVIPELDAGPGIIQYRIPVRPGDTEESLRERVLHGEHIIYPRAIGWVVSGRAELRENGVWLESRHIAAPVVVAEGG